MTPESQPPQAQSPLTPAELAELEATLLPALERHHLRLLAHGLRTLQEIAAQQPTGSIPDHGAIRTWASQQPALAEDPCFQAVLVEQLEATGRQLQQLAVPLGRAALDLELGDLIAAACDHRQSPSTPVSAIRPESIADALSFFRLSCGRWRSQRSSHHLLHRRAEAGGSFIEVVEIDAADPRLIAIAELHGENPAGLVGGCRVTWNASMAWDKAGEAHEGAGLTHLQSPQPVAVLGERGSDAIDERVALLARERAREVLHHDRIRVERGERLEVLFAPLAKEQPFGPQVERGAHCAWGLWATE